MVFYHIKLTTTIQSRPRQPPPYQVYNGVLSHQTHNYHTITTTTTPSLTSIQWCFITSNSQLPYNHNHNNPLLNKYTMVFYHIKLTTTIQSQPQHPPP